MRLLQSWYDSAVQEVAADRKLDRTQLAAILDTSPMMVDTAKDKGLITNIGYEDDARDAAKKQAGSGAETMRFDRYVQATRNDWDAVGAPTIALVHAAGEIVEGTDDNAIGNTTTSIAGDTFSDAIREAAKDSNVKAILLRVDSPGGSAIASDQILQALKKARATGKPIVVSMGSVAASGGYFISMAADKIVAEPGTLTGSIGVIFGKVAVGKSLELAGVEGRELGVGRCRLSFTDRAAHVSVPVCARNSRWTRKDWSG